MPLEPREEGVGAEETFVERPQSKCDRLSRKESRLKRILTQKKKPFTRAALRSSLCLELGIGTEFDIGSVLDSPSPRSPSAQSIDLGAVFSRSYEEYAVLEINGQELLDRNYAAKDPAPTHRKSIS